MNRLKTVGKFGQSIWLDYIRRDLISSGELHQLIANDGLSGITSNPAIFAQAFASDNIYSKAIKALLQQEKDVETIYETLAQQDVGAAADEFRSLYEQTEGKEGYVSLEVNPYLANDAAGTIAEARRLWQALDRPNVLIKVPGTEQGIIALQQLISEGINVNVTLLFAVPRYAQIADAYIAGLAARLERDEPIDHIASVASFFLSRIDVLLDPILQQHIDQDDEHAILAQKLQGQVAIASAKQAYQIFTEKFYGPSFQGLAKAGAKVQRLLWASTGTKDSRYSDVKYVDAVIAADTVNTLPMQTFKAYLDHGDPAPRLSEDKENILAAFARLPLLGIDMEKVCRKLETEGIKKFNQAFDQLLNTLQQLKR